MAYSPDWEKSGTATDAFGVQAYVLRGGSLSVDLGATAPRQFGLMQGSGRESSAVTWQSRGAVSGRNAMWWLFRGIGETTRGVPGTEIFTCSENHGNGVL